MDGKEQPFTNKHFKAYFKNAYISMIFVCREQSIYTRAILANQKICFHDFFVGGGHLGGTENLWGGGHVPPRPPVATPLVRVCVCVCVCVCVWDSNALCPCLYLYRVAPPPHPHGTVDTIDF